MRERAHAAGERRRFREVGNRAPHVQRQLRTRPLDRAVRHATADAAVHRAHRRHRRLLPGLPRRPAGRPGRRANRGAGHAVDAVDGPDGGPRARDGRHTRVLPALHPQGPRPRRQPDPARRGRRLQGDRRHARHVGDGLASHGTSTPPTSRSCGGTAWPTTSPTSTSSGASRRSRRTTSPPRRRSGRASSATHSPGTT